MVVGDCSRWHHLWFLYCRWDKTRRASSDKDKPEDITRGEAYHNHGLRKVSANAAVCGMSSWICRYQVADIFTIIGSLCCCLIVMHQCQMRHDCMHCASHLSDMFVLHAVSSWQKHQHFTRLEGESLMLCNASMFMQCMLHHA